MARGRAGRYASSPVERIARLVVMHPRLVVAAIAVFTVLLANELRGLRLEVRLADEVPREHPYTRIDDRLAEALGLHQTSLLAIGVREGDVFTPGTLARIRRLTDGVARLPGVVPSSVLSLTSPNAKAVSGDADAVRVEALVGPTLPDTPEALRALRERTFSFPMYVGTIVTPDARGAMILADFRDEISSERITEGLEALAARERDADTEILVGGQSPALAAVNGATRGIVPLVALALVVIALVHYEAFRTGQAVVLPLATASLSVVWAMGITGALGFSLTPWTAITAVLVLSVAAGHAVQILKRYYECFHELGDNRAAVAASLVRIGPVMAIACSIAAAGFASLAGFGVPAVRDFGLMAAFGIVSTLVLELTFIPACRTLLRAPRSMETARERSHHVLDPALDRLAALVQRAPRAVVVAVLAGVAVAAAGVVRLEVGSSFRSWFDADAPIIVADREIRSRFTGTSTIRVLVEGDEPDTLLDPRVLRGMVALQRALAEEPEAITATVSLADYVQTMNRAMDGGRPEAYRVPDDRDLIAQYLLLFEPGDLVRVASPDLRSGAVHAFSRWDRVDWVERLFVRLREVAARSFPPGVRVSVAGGELGQAAAMNASVVRNKLANMIQVGSVIFLLSSLVFRSLRIGLLVLAPLACAALVNLGVMGWIGSWLSFATASYTAMGVSLGADFAIYLIFRLREELRTRPLPDAVAEAMRTSGRAIFFVASAIAAGNATLLASDFALWRQLGGYVALMMTTSCLATLTLVPALVLLVGPRLFRGRRGDAAALDRAA